jgi:hypothetical protein
VARICGILMLVTFKNWKKTSLERCNRGEENIVRIFLIYLREIVYEEFVWIQLGWIESECRHL